MFKYAYSLAFLVQLVVAQNAQSDDTQIYHENGQGYDAEVVTEWTEQISSQCIDECNQICVTPCPVSRKCSEDENKCGELDLPPNVWPDCRKDDECVPKDCHCPTLDIEGNECALVCEQTCSSTEIKCPGKTNDNGCTENDFCVPRGVDDDGDLCPGFCPVECPDQCPNEPDSRGCAVPPSCVPKNYDSSGGLCPNTACPIICEAEVEEQCKGKVTVEGCIPDDICVPKETSDDGVLCPGRCPVYCEPWVEILCTGQEIFHAPFTGCYSEDECRPVAKTCTGEACPDDSDSHGCPLTCPPPDYIKCPAQPTNYCCLTNVECTLRTTGDNGEYCPDDSVCPTVCQPNEVRCELTQPDDNGCKKPDICVVQQWGANVELCPVHCPPECADNEILCDGGKNSVGCDEPDICVKREIKQWGDDKGGLCPGVCPPHDCKENEYVCPDDFPFRSRFDICDGCPLEKFCIEPALDKNALECPLESASHKCPHICNEVERSETLCPPLPTPNGCLNEPLCMQRTIDNQGEFCPYSSVCPIQCNLVPCNETMCHGGYDARNCKREDLCIPRGINNDGNLCAGTCPPLCTETEIYCAGPNAAQWPAGNGCDGNDYCVNKGTDRFGELCDGACPIVCAPGEKLKFKGFDKRWCLLPFYCE